MVADERFLETELIPCLSDIDPDMKLVAGQSKVIFTVRPQSDWASRWWPLG